MEKGDSGAAQCLRGPEVESVVRSLRRGIIGRRILNAELKNGRVLIGSAATTSRALAGRRINAIERHGKFIAIHLDQGFLVVHLGMTGRLLLNAEPDKWTHAIFNLDRGTLIYSDPRQFGRIEYGRALPERVAKLRTGAFGGGGSTNSRRVWQSAIRQSKPYC